MTTYERRDCKVYTYLAVSFTSIYVPEIIDVL